MHTHAHAKVTLPLAVDEASPMRQVARTNPVLRRCRLQAFPQHIGVIGLEAARYTALKHPAAVL